MMSSDNPYPHLKGFVALPSDPNVKLTPEQMDALFQPENRPQFLKALIIPVMKKNNIAGVLPETLPQLKSDKDENS